LERGKGKETRDRRVMRRNKTGTKGKKEPEGDRRNGHLLSFLCFSLLIYSPNVVLYLLELSYNLPTFSGPTFLSHHLLFLLLYLGKGITSSSLVYVGGGRVKLLVGVAWGGTLVVWACTVFTNVDSAQPAYRSTQFCMGSMLSFKKSLYIQYTLVRLFMLMSGEPMFRLRYRFFGSLIPKCSTNLLL
jgi:hypothetical protein